MPKSAVRSRSRSASSKAIKPRASSSSKGRTPRAGGKARSKPTSPAATKARASSGSSTVKLDMFVIDAFTRRPFHGNPAAIVLLGKEQLSTDTMQRIASENNLSTTAFVSHRPRVGHYAIRWFTPTIEVDLCGHATLASAFALWNHAKVKGTFLVFESASGKFSVDKRDGLIVLDFPARPARRTGASRHLTQALGREPTELYQLAGAGSTILAVFENKRDIHELAPDFARLRDLDAPSVIVTAPGAGHDFVCRYFAPSKGVDEDPVTGSAHCTLVPYWAARLGRTILTSHQVSKRGGELYCELVGSRVRIAGHAVTYSAGSLILPRNQ